MKSLILSFSLSLIAGIIEPTNMDMLLQKEAGQFGPFLNYSLAFHLSCFTFTDEEFAQNSNCAVVAVVICQARLTEIVGHQKTDANNVFEYINSRCILIKPIGGIYSIYKLIRV